MNIENEMFKKTKLKIDTLISYGFLKKNGCYEYSKVFMENFKAIIKIDTEGIVTGKVFDLNTNDEYTNFRIKNNQGEFGNSIRNEYINILNDIKEGCFEKFYFSSDQANRITKMIIEKYEAYPEFIWKKFPRYGVFRNFNTRKWFGLIMNIDRSKLNKKESGEVEIINLKLNSEEIPHLLNKKGFYPSYHMNKKNWISIILDDTLSDDELMNYIDISYKFC